MRIRTIGGGQSFSAKDCGACEATGRTFDATMQDMATGDSPFVKCSRCNGYGEILTFMPDAKIAEGMAHEENSLRISREAQTIGEMPDWMC